MIGVKHEHIFIVTLHTVNTCLSVFAKKNI